MIHKNYVISEIPKLAKKPRVCLVASKYYEEITNNLISGCLEVLKSVNSIVDIVEVSGALEIPTAIKLLEHEYDGFVAIGCVIRGETSHYEIVSNHSSQALANLGLQKFCIGNCILTVENERQAKERADPLKQNKGGQASHAMLRLLEIKQEA